MNDCDALPFIARWKEGKCHDAALDSVIHKARQEFPALTDEQVKGLGEQLELLLVEWAKHKGMPLPCYKLRHTRNGVVPNPWLESDKSANAIDYVVLFLLVDKYAPLQRFLEGLDAEPFASMGKAYALLMLMEAGEGNWVEVHRLARSFERVVH